MIEGNPAISNTLAFGALLAGILIVLVIDNWMKGKAGRRFFTAGVIATMTTASAFWWGGHWWLTEQAANHGLGYGMIVIAVLLGLGIVLRNFSGATWPWAIAGTGMQLTVAYALGGVLVLFMLLLLLAVFAAGFSTAEDRAPRHHVYTDSVER